MPGNRTKANWPTVRSPADAPGALDMPLTSTARAIPRVARATPEPVSGGEAVVSPLQRAKNRDVEYHFGSCFRAERVFFGTRFVLFSFFFSSLLVVSQRTRTHTLTYINRAPFSSR